jgi:hypothetical protein
MELKLPAWDVLKTTGLKYKLAELQNPGTVATLRLKLEFVQLKQQCEDSDLY